MVRPAPKKFVVDAVVAKKLVVVALVVVECVAVNLCNVVEPVTRREESMVEEAVERKPLRNPRVVEVETPQEVGVQAKAPPLPPLGQEVSQVSPEKQMVSKVAFIKSPSVVSCVMRLEK